jgi:hypothetical protein
MCCNSTWRWMRCTDCQGGVPEDGTAPMRLLRRPQPDAGAQPCSQPTHAQQVLLSPAAEDADGLRVRRNSVNNDLEIVGWAPGFLSIRFTMRSLTRRLGICSKNPRYRRDLSVRAGNLLSRKIAPGGRAHSDRVKVWLCLPKSAMRVAMAAVMRTLPAAEFGRITPVSGAPVPIARHRAQ